jgi:hypothetical protein
VLRNGGFEEGFKPNELGEYWEGFNNGSAAFSYHIDDWPLVVPQERPKARPLFRYLPNGKRHPWRSLRFLDAGPGPHQHR